MPLVLGLLELVGYREWTESLGDDREWRIQVSQARLYSVLQEEVARYGGFVTPLSYDVMILVLNGVPREHYGRLYSVAVKFSPVPVSLQIISVDEPSRLKPLGKPGLYIDTIKDSPLAALHIDLNSFTRLRRHGGIITPYLKILEEYITLAKLLGDNAVPAYLGGGNVVFFISTSLVRNALARIESVIDTREYKVGVGIGPSARAALAAAAEALHTLREGRVSTWYLIVKA